MDEKKFVTLEMFEQYDTLLKEYINAHDGLDDESTCHMTSEEEVEDNG